MKESEVRRPARTWAVRLSAIGHEIKDLAKNANLRATVALFLAVIAWTLADNLVFYREISAISLFGWVDILWRCLPWAMAALLPLWSLGRRSYFVYAILGVVAIFLEFLQWFVQSNFNMTLTGSWVGMLALSSPNEMMLFFRQYAIDLILSCLLPTVLAIGVFFLILSLVRRVSVTRTSLVCALFGCTIFFYGTGFPSSGGDPFRDFMAKAKGRSAIYCMIDSVRNGLLMLRLSHMAKEPTLPPTLHAADDRDVVGVFVLGESATRNHWGLYGYPRDTTPKLSAIRDEMACFDNLITTDPTTGEAMRSLFSTRTLENRGDVRYTMSQALAKCGYAVSLCSNQERWNNWGSDESFSFAGCDPFLVIREQDAYRSVRQDLGTNRCDGVLLPYLDGALANGKARQVVFLHLYGSHTPLEFRCPPELAPFEVRTNDSATARHALSVDAYDNSIWYTDRLLGEIVRKLKALNKPAWMVYISDHGETPSAKSWRSATDLDLWEVPFVVWTSESFNAAFPERVAALRRAQSKPLQSDQLLYGLLRFMGVEGLGVTPQEDFLDDAFAPRRPRLIQSGQVPYPERTR